MAWLAVATLPPRPVLRHPGRATVALAAAALLLAAIRLMADAHHLAVGAWGSLMLAALLLADAAPVPSADRTLPVQAQAGTGSK